jgi:hypothetical protein
MSSALSLNTILNFVSSEQAALFEFRQWRLWICENIKNKFVYIMSSNAWITI